MDFDIKKIKVFYDKDGVRKIKCFCNEICNRSIIPHMKMKHFEEWVEWLSDFVRLRNEGWSYRRIMKKYKTLFSWTIIEKEIKKIVENGEASLKVWGKKKIDKWQPTSEEFKLPSTTIWSFPKRGTWAVHQSDYRGNWSPQVPRVLILKYTKEGDMVLDPFVGGGTTLIEAWLTNRKSIGIDISPMAIMISKERIKELKRKGKNAPVNLRENLEPIIKRGDARKCSQILQNLGFETESVDLICAHPPYLNTLKYTENVEGDLSHIKDVKLFCNEIQKVAKELYLLLKKGGRCGVLIGDIRKNKMMVPLGFLVMEHFLREKFILEDIIIKQQHQDSSTEFYYRKENINYLIVHEYLFIFKK